MDSATIESGRAAPIMSSCCAAGSSACSCSGSLGTVTELVLLEHYEQALQFVPLVLIAPASRRSSGS